MAVIDGSARYLKTISLATIVPNAPVKVNMENEPTFTIHGARGTMAVSGRAFNR